MDEHCRGCMRYLKSCSGMSKRLCEKHKLRIPITNADKLRSMTDEELAEWLSKSDPECDPPEWWLNWLKQETE